MRLKLKENPREWRKFTLVWTVAASLLIFLLHRRGTIASIRIPAVLVILFFLAGVMIPGCMRWPYRGVMTISFRIGQVMGRILLTIFFLLVLTPLGLILRALGKDLLQIKKQSRDTYWENSPPESAHDRMF